MANTYLTSNLISKEAAALFSVFNSFIATGNKQYEGMYSNAFYKPGDTINARLANFYTVQRGDSVVAGAITEASIPVVIERLYSVPILYRPTDLQREIADFSEEFLAPAVQSIVAQMNYDIYLKALTQVNYWTGDATANLNSYGSISQLNPIMANLAMPKMYRKYVVLSPTQLNLLMSASSLQNSFVTPLNKEITMDASLTRLAGFDIYEDQSVANFAIGTHSAAGAITVKTDVSTGSTIVLTGLTSGTFLAGEIISIAGCYEFNPVLKKPTARNMQFVITADATVAAGDVTLSVYPAIQFTGERQNIYAAANKIAATSVVTVAATHTPNIAYTEKGLITCLPPLERMDCPFSDTYTDPTTKISIRISKTAEVMENKNVMRLDAQMAAAWVPQQAVRLISL